MAKHDFGIMPQAPQHDVRYDEYEPKRYHCIAVEDDVIETVDPLLCEIPMLWHTTDVPGKGLAYCGVTLIPPDASRRILEVLPENPELNELCTLLETACAMGKWVIHYGI